MDADMWKCHHDCSTDLWFRASCQQEMPSCYLHSFKRSKKTAGTWKQEKGKRCGPAFGNLAKNKKPADSSKLLSPTNANSFQNCWEQDEIHLDTAELLSSLCWQQPGTWEDRCKEVPYSILGRNILRLPGPLRDLGAPQSQHKVAYLQELARLHPQCSRARWFFFFSRCLRRKDRAWALHSLLGVASSSGFSWSSKQTFS